MSSFNVSGASLACGVGGTIIPFTYKYAAGSVVYNIQQAGKGVLEAVRIRRVLLNNTVYGQIVPLYVDTYNGMWSENMLCLEADARALAISYLEREQAFLMSSCN